MSNSIILTGQWVGHFMYGPENGDELYGQKVSFRLFLEILRSGEFKGTSIDTEGFGTNMDIATIQGFLKDDFISFTKEYPKYYIIDENGESHDDPSILKPRLSYSGYYNSRTKMFSGEWELWANERPAGEGTMVDIFTGTWEMIKDD